MTVKDMVDIQQDTRDTMARRVTFNIVPIARMNINLLEKEEDRNKVLELVKILSQTGWLGDMGVNRREPTVYHVWIYEFYVSLFNDMFKNESDILALISNYPFRDFILHLLENTEKDPKKNRYNIACAGAYNKEFKGEEKCAYNVLKSFLIAHEKLNNHYGKDSLNWKWGNWHTNEYPNMPWSAIPGLKLFFHRSVSTPGSQNTPNVSKFKWSNYSKNHLF